MGRIGPGVAFIAFQFPSFCHRVKAITRESRTLPHLGLDIQTGTLKFVGNVLLSRVKPPVRSFPVMIHRIYPVTGMGFVCRV